MIKITNKSYKPKPLGIYLVEAGLITPVQLQLALDAQKVENKRLGEIIAQYGWIEQQSIEDLVKNVVIPERSNLQSHYKWQRPSQYKQVVSNQYEPVAAKHQLEILISSKKILWSLIGVIFTLFAAHLITQLTVFYLPDYPFRDFLGELFNLDRELNVPSFYSMLSLLVCSILLGLIAYAKQIAGDRFVRQWTALAVIFLALAVDEIMSFHERITQPLRSALNTSGFLYYAWVIPGAILVLVCLLLFWQFLIALPTETRQLFFLAGTVFISGAIGFEVISGYYAHLHGDQDIFYAMIASTEEILEMLGVVIFIYALLAYMSSAMRGLSLRIQIAEHKPSARKKLTRCQNVG